MLNELHPVARAAAQAIDQIMVMGETKHGQSWRGRSDAIDLDHASAHLVCLAASDVDEDHLAHALARLAIVVARRALLAGRESP